MGAFNDWTKSSYLAESSQRNVTEIAHHLITGAAYLYPLQNLKLQGLLISANYWSYRPQK